MISCQFWNLITGDRVLPSVCLFLLLILSLNQNCTENCLNPTPVILKEFGSTIYMGMARRILASPRWVQKGLGSGQVVALSGEGPLCIPLPPA